MFTLQTSFKPLLPRGRGKESNPLVGEEKFTGEKQRRGRVHDVWWESRREKKCSAEKQRRVHGVWGEQRREETLLVRSREEYMARGRGSKGGMNCIVENQRRVHGVEEGERRREVYWREAEKSTWRGGGGAEERSGLARSREEYMARWTGEKQRRVHGVWGRSRGKRSVLAKKQRRVHEVWGGRSRGEKKSTGERQRKAHGVWGREQQRRSEAGGGAEERRSVLARSREEYMACGGGAEEIRRVLASSREKQERKGGPMKA
jgi:hypothetical protein